MALLLWICAVTAVAITSLLPGTTLQDSPLAHLNDKVEHVAGYLVSAGLAVLSFRRIAVQVAAAAALIPFGIALEFAQRLVPGRAYDASDMVADSAGVAAGMALGWISRRVAGRFSGIQAGE